MTARVALVGYGSAGRGIHAPLLVDAGAPPAIVVTSSAERADQARTDLPGVEVVPDLDAALAAGPDLAVLASPSGVHAQQALACVIAGVPLVVDKPIAVDTQQARSVVDAALAAEVPMTVFQNRRWDAENLTLADVLLSGVLGKVHRFERRWERWRPEPKDRWREKASAAQGGGLLLDLGPHLVDSALLLFGAARSVYAELATWTTAAEDDVFLSVLHESGVRSHLTAGSVVGAPGPRTRVLGSTGAYVVTDFGGRFGGEVPAFGGFTDAEGHTGWLVRGEDRTPVRTAPGGYEDFYRSVLAALALAEPADRQAAMPVDPRDAVAVAEVLDAARESAESGRAILLG